MQKFCILLFFLMPLPGIAQLQIDTSFTIDWLVKKMLVGKNPNLAIENIRYSGAQQSIGYFNNSAIKILAVAKGLILSTGNVYDAEGPNNSPNIGTKTINNNDSDLEKITKEKTFDAAVLEFDFVPVLDSISFRFFFGSEEYPEYTNRGINDIFGIFISNKEMELNENLAIINGSQTPISIDNINATRNCEYYIDNGRWDENNILKWVNNKALGELALSFQFDGFTKVMSAGIKIIPGKKYHIKFAIADVADRIFDSAIFLEAGSFICVESSKPKAKPFFNE